MLLVGANLFPFIPSVAERRPGEASHPGPVSQVSASGECSCMDIQTINVTSLRTHFSGLVQA
eukprot:12992957-Alexandrium_andersonii.AAC.1